jgi:heat shock protein HtpX
VPSLDEAALSRHKQRNLVHSVLLLGSIGLILLISSVLIWGAIGILWAGLAVAALVSLAPRIPPEAIMRLYGAKRVDPRLGHQIEAVAATLAARAGLPVMPKLYVIPSITLNAFATGTLAHPVIAVTEGLLRRLSIREIAGVLAHEMSHIRNDDLWVMSIADAMTRLSQALSYIGALLAVLNIAGSLTGDRYAPWSAVLLLYLAPMLSSLLQLALSRTREYEADVEGALLSGDPLGLASALGRIERYTGHFWEDLAPMPGRRVPQPSLLRSHPPTEKRIKRLMQLEGTVPAAAIDVQEAPMISLIGVGPIEMRPRYRWSGFWF